MTIFTNYFLMTLKNNYSTKNNLKYDIVYRIEKKVSNTIYV